MCDLIILSVTKRKMIMGIAIRGLRLRYRGKPI